MKNKLKRWIMTLSGIVFMGVGVAAATVPELGTDPLAGFNEVLSKMTGISLGRMTSLVQALMIVLCLIFNRKSIGIGTLLSMYLVQFPIDVTVSALSKPQSVITGIIFVLIGTALIALGAELVITADLGIGPYDAFITTVGKLIGLKFTYAKYIFDGTFLVLTLLLKGNVGIGTLIILLLCPKLMELIGNRIKTS